MKNYIIESIFSNATTYILENNKTENSYHI
jgi:hypothetical protein